MLFILFYSEIVKLPGSFLLEGNIVGLVAVDAAVIKVKTLDLTIGHSARLHQRDELHLAADNLRLAMFYTQRCHKVGCVREHNDVHRELFAASVT